MKASVLLLIAGTAVGCGPSSGGADPVAVPGRSGALKTAAVLRAERRAYDGAPPVIPHAPMGAACTQCHHAEGIDVPGLGFAPPMPHERTSGLSALSRCEQCHVYRNTAELFVESGFAGLPQDLRRGSRLYPGAPPVIPHSLLLRENCRACHAGPAAREEVRCTHPERSRCVQCHVERNTGEEFARQ